MDSNKKNLILAGSLAAVALILLGWYFLGGGAPKAGSVIEGSKNPPPPEGQDPAQEGTGGGRGMGGPAGPSTAGGN